MSLPDNLLSETEVAERLKWSVYTLRDRRSRGKPPAFIRIGSSVRYDPAIIQAFIDAGRVSPGEDAA
jgi:hypothetical protein